MITYHFDSKTKFGKHFTLLTWSLIIIDILGIIIRKVVLGSIFSFGCRTSPVCRGQWEVPWFGIYVLGCNIMQTMSMS